MTLLALLLCSLIDSFVRMWLYEYYSTQAPSVVLSILAGWLSLFLMLVFVGDSVAYLFFALLFYSLSPLPFVQRHKVWSYPLLGALLAGLFFALVGQMRFWAPYQLIVMEITYTLLGALYGYLIGRWVRPLES